MDIMECPRRPDKCPLPPWSKSEEPEQPKIAQRKRLGKCKAVFGQLNL